MGRYTGPACKLCRREGTKLFLKGDRCFMAKCAIEQGRMPPGQHGARRSRKMSDYGVQLREKQKLRRMYGVQEGPFRLIFERANNNRGVTGEVLLQLLEMRLDNLVYRFGFAGSRRGARQFIRHGHILVNGHKATIPSMVLTEGDEIQVKSDEDSRNLAKLSVEVAVSRGVSAWLKLDHNNLKGEVLKVPTREDIAAPVNEQLIVELYSK